MRAQPLLALSLSVLVLACGRSDGGGAAPASTSVVQATPAASVAPAAGVATWSVELRSFLGCHGAGPADAAVQLSADAAGLPPRPVWAGSEAGVETDDAATASQASPLTVGDACLADVPVWLPCDRPAPPSAMDLDDDGEASAAQLQRRRDEATAEYERAERDWQAFVGRHEAWLGALQALFPGPRSRVTVRNGGARPTADALLVLFDYVPTLSGYCAVVETATRQDLQHRVVPLPALAPGASVSFWFDTPGYQRDYGAFVAVDLAEAQRLVEALGETWQNTPEASSLPLLLPDWARARADIDGPGPDECPSLACGC